MKILVNHIGYNIGSPKFAVVEISDKEIKNHYKLPEKAFLKLQNDGMIITEINLEKFEIVPGWKNRHFCRMNFSEIDIPGRYFFEITYGSSPEESYKSEYFEIDDNLLTGKTLNSLLIFFRAMRSTDKYDRRDYSIPVYGSEHIKKNVHGGWYDASGDYSKYLSHLSYTNYMNPQQTPLLVWQLFDSLENLKGVKEYAEEYKEAFTLEALYGADFLIRMQSDEGYFYMILFDKWSKDLERRKLCSYTTQEGIYNKNYQAAYRQGGGMAIAALARASMGECGGEFSRNNYLAAAEKGFRHLEEHNIEYLNDKKENIIDDYCALFAASELYNATGNPDYKSAAEKRKDSLLDRLSSDKNFSNWLRADDKGDIPFFHASDAGLPVLSLIRYLEIFFRETALVADTSCSYKEVIDFLEKYLTFELETTESTTNPFILARQYVKPLKKEKKATFFIPHDNWSGYWWQGENSRLASLAAAAWKAEKYMDDQKFRKKLTIYAWSQINWILGLNPFNTCMLTGKGHNNVQYEHYWRNLDGGIINGITADMDEECDIAFLPEPEGNDPNHRWRWSEQWLIHSGWFAEAISISTGKD